MIYTYKGRDINTLSIEELREALRHAYKELQSEREWHRRDVEMKQAFQDARVRLGVRR